MVSRQSKKADIIRLLHSANRFLIILIIGLSGYILVKYFASEQNIVLMPDGREIVSEKISSAASMVDEVKPFRVYEEGLKNRDLFQLVGNKVKPDPAVMQKALPALHKRIKLIGILLDGDSKAIVEDLKEKQTHFLSRGESIGTVFLEDIQEDKAIFMYNNERIEMTP